MIPSIKIIHKLPMRLRVKLSAPIKSENFWKKNLTGERGINSFKYSPHSRSIVVTFSPDIISMESLLTLLVLLFSLESDSGHIKVIEEQDVREVSPFAFLVGLYIVIMILSGEFVGAVTRSRLRFSSLVLTLLAIVEHAMMDLKKNGAFDPETISIVYLFSALSNGEYLKTSAITWLTVFGRHILHISSASIIYKIYRLDKDGEKKYHLLIENQAKISDLGDLVKEFYNKLSHDNHYHANSLIDRIRFKHSNNFIFEIS